MLHLPGLSSPSIAPLAIAYAEPPAFSGWEKALFLLLAIASLAGFFARFGKVLTRIFESKKDADFHLAPIGRRIWDFFWEVMCQGKVIKERPLPGLAHAFVFWGFCAFALVTLNHFASGVGWPFLSRESWVGAVYLYLAGA